jgi:hypothetical protein
MTMSVGCVISSEGDPRPETLQELVPQEISTVTRPRRSTSFSSSVMSRNPFDAATATIQSPAGVRWHSLVISIVVLCLAITFLCPAAVMSISITVASCG